MKNFNNEKTDICLILEGTYPYVQGGVSTWVHDIILNNPQSSFSIITLLPNNFNVSIKYEVPKNVISIKNVFLTTLPIGKKIASKKKKKLLAHQLEENLCELFIEGNLDYFYKLVDLFEQNFSYLGHKILFDSKVSWEIIQKMYVKGMNNSSFNDFFWSWRSLLGSVFSVLLTKLPKARCYHSICTGYAGVLLAKASHITKRPCMLTEHGIYTNERRIELASAKWLFDQSQYSLSVHKDDKNFGLQEMWANYFLTYSRICYNNCDNIITLYEGNKDMQVLDGADKNKTQVIPNGIDYEKFAKIKPAPKENPTVALIGRVVPIKDIKNYIKSISIVKNTIPNLKAYILGPYEEDKKYAEECFDIVKDEGLQNIIEFTGKVKIDDYLPKIDILVLTSMSEAQPLVILEAGAAGIPTVATDVGSCREIIEGHKNEEPNLGNGGIVVPLSNSRAVAAALISLITDGEFHERCSDSIKNRVKKHYGLKKQHSAYTKLYENMINT